MNNQQRAQQSRKWPHKAHTLSRIARQSHAEPDPHCNHGGMVKIPRGRSQCPYAVVGFVRCEWNKRGQHKAEQGKGDQPAPPINRHQGMSLQNYRALQIIVADMA